MIEAVSHACTVAGVVMIALGLVGLCVADAFRPPAPARPFDQERDERAAAAALHPRGEVLAVPRVAPVRNPAVASRPEPSPYATPIERRGHSHA